MARILLTGATGRLGRALQPRLTAAGHEVRTASRSPPVDGGSGDDDSVDRDPGVAWMAMDLVDGTGIEAAVDGVDTIIHAASAPQGDSEAVDVEGTKRLLAAADAAGVSHVVYPSIVGIEEIPYRYYDHKLAAEDAVTSSSVPSTVLRATQFHCFLDEILDTVSWLPIWPLPTKLRLQPISVDTVAEALVEAANGEPAGRLADRCGPEVNTLGELAATYRDVRGLRRPIVRLPVPGSVARAFRDGQATRPERAAGTEPWEEWLAGRYAGQEPAVSRSDSPTR